MKVLQLGKFYPVRGGVEKVMYDLTLGLSSSGVDCDMLCARIEKDTDVDKDGIVRLNDHGRVLTVKAYKKLAGTMLAPALITRLRKICREYDIIHVHHPDPMAALALMLSGYKGKVVLHWHSDILSQKAMLVLYKPLQNWLIKRADLILGTTPIYIAQSPHLAAARERKQDMSFLPIGVKPVRSAADDEALAEQTAAIRAQYGNRRIVYSLGRLIPYKGYRYLVEAAQYLPEDCCVLIGGAGPLKSELEEQIASLGLQDKVFLLGRIDDDKFDAYYNACDVFCLSSIWKTEAFAIVQIEAMSLGKPIVATQIPESGVSWVNAHGISGLNAPVEDPKALAENLIKVLDAKEEFGARAKQRFEENFTFGKMTEGCLKNYAEVLK